MQVLMSSGRWSRAFLTRWGSAKNGRAMLIMSAQPSASASSHVAGSLKRLVVMRGTPTFPISFWVTNRNPPRGTMVAMVGMRASCQPMPVLIKFAPARSVIWASRSTSSQLDPPATKSSMLNRYMMRKSSPTASRMRVRISSGKRQRRSKSPPHRSVRWLVSATRNWLMRYPSDPMISTPS